MSEPEAIYITNVQDCQFCYSNIKDRVVAEYGSVVAIKDGFPVSENHMLIIPKNHSVDYFYLSQQEREDANSLICQLRKEIMNVDHTVTGFNIGINCGESAGQTIFHTHIHLIPRRDGDTPDPRGGVRGVIPDKMGY
jgi:ATP adenylyltransferase